MDSNYFSFLVKKFRGLSYKRGTQCVIDKIVIASYKPHK